MRNRDTRKHTAKVPEVVDDERGETDLAYDVLPAVDSCRSNTLCEHDENQSHIVGPRVHALQEIVAKLCAVR